MTKQQLQELYNNGIAASSNLTNRLVKDQLEDQETPENFIAYLKDGKESIIGLIEQCEALMKRSAKVPKKAQL